VLPVIHEDPKTTSRHGNFGGHVNLYAAIITGSSGRINRATLPALISSLFVYAASFVGENRSIATEKRIESNF
jgi:hypothetical protein